MYNIQSHYVMCISYTSIHVVPSYKIGPKFYNIGYQSYLTKGSSTLDRSLTTLDQSPSYLRHTWCMMLQQMKKNLHPNLLLPLLLINHQTGLKSFYIGFNSYNAGPKSYNTGSSLNLKHFMNIANIRPQQWFLSKP